MVSFSTVAIQCGIIPSKLANIPYEWTTAARSVIYHLTNSHPNPAEWVGLYSIERVELDVDDVR